MEYRKEMMDRFAKIGIAAMAATAMLFGTGCGMEADDDAPRSGLNLDEHTEVRIQELNSFCTVQLVGYGAVDVETDYLPSVIACENGNAPMEALKAQAVAARTYAMFITEAERRPLATTEADQVYDCSYATVEQRHIDAVEATRGQVLMHGDRLIAGFYVAGSIPSAANSCEATSSDNDPTNTERFVTYNRGRIGSNVHPTPLGHPGNPANRGAKSQNGAACLANQGWDYERILRFYYGDDIRARAAETSECAAAGGQPAGDICQIATGGVDGGNAPGCVDPSQMPNILPRSSWGARPPTGNRLPHTPNRISVHHTVTPNGAADGAHWVRQVQNWHMNDNGWADIGYHFLISWDGTIYRGNPEERSGAHARNDNFGNLGIALIGRYDTGHPSEEQIQSLVRMLRYLGDKYGIDLNRNQVKGHGEWPTQATACPGTNLRNQLDQIVEMARGDSVCQGGESADPPQGDMDITEYRYVRVSGVDLEPSSANDIIDGFEVDSIYFERANNGSTSTVQASRVLCSPGVSNPSGALGEPDNTSCENRPTTVAGVPVGANLVVELSEPMRVGDQLFVTQHRYLAQMSECGPTGTAQISVSSDGRIWKVLDPGASGNWRQTLDNNAFTITEDDEPALRDDGFELISPRAGHWYTPEVTFSVLTTNPAISRVAYLADSWEMGDSETRSNNFRMTYEFQYYGQRRIEAVGYDASGTEIARQQIMITVTDYHGLIPEGQEVIPPLPEPGVADSAMAETLASEGGRCYHPSYGGGVARCSNGTGGSSIGYCWGYVKHAMIRAGYDVNILAGTGPCSWHTYHASAFGFRCNADPNPAALLQMGFERIDVPATQAPRGAIIVWDRGCVGFHAVHGHIEIAQGTGLACSDYCGNIRSGGQSCSSVYIPVAN